MRFKGFIGPSYTLNSVNVDCQRCLNLFPELDELGTGKDKEVGWLQSTPGLSLLTTIGLGPHRGAWRSTAGILYVVSGNTLYQVSSSWVATSLGTLTTSTGRVGMADNGYQLAITDGGPNVYNWDFTALTLTQVAIPIFQNTETLVSYPAAAGQVIYQDGYFIFNIPNTPVFFISGILTITFDPLDFTVLSGNPNSLVTMLSQNENLWLFSFDSTNVFYNSGAIVEVNGSPQSAFPFTQVTGAFIETGTGHAFAALKLNQTLFWLGQDRNGDRMVYMANGYQPVRISTSAVESAINGYASISDATAFGYQSEGHSFYVLNFTAANATWVYDANTGLWHERAYTSQGQFQRHRAETHAFVYGAHVVGDYDNGNLYKLDSNVYTDNGQPISRLRASPHVSTDMVRQFFSAFQLDIETGTGLDGIQQGTDPQAILQWSDDGGHTWSNEKWTSFGKIGHTRARANWNRLGQGRNRVFRIIITDPVKVALIGAELMVEAGDS